MKSYFRAVSWLRRSLDGFSPRETDFDLRLDHVGFVVERVALR
jgi:hypothetical protein